jgi:hypothetical protein
VTDLRLAALAQTVLEGVPLPARKRNLLDYARAEDAEPEVVAAIERLPDGSYDSLDDVGEALASAQPSRKPVLTQAPQPESGEPPGRDAYLTPAPPR